tara:strand:+ start:751 stop:969 length:219 start_codon:yes stop_codon:yes gene_type:complete
MNEVVYNERYIVSALHNGKLRLEAFLSPIEARRHAENLAAETRYDDKPRYERVQIIDEKSGLPVEVLGYNAA